jgi:hypothetical protein
MAVLRAVEAAERLIYKGESAARLAAPTIILRAVDSKAATTFDCINVKNTTQGLLSTYRERAIRIAAIIAIAIFLAFRCGPDALSN